jgi:branched-chain amino acid transport system permease protein
MTVVILFAPKSIRLAGERSFIVRTRGSLERAPRGAVVGVGAAVFGVLALLPLGSISWLLAFTQALTYSIIFLSLVILTGYSGQISLGHTAFIGIASFTTAHLVSGAGVSPWLALFLGALAAVPAGVLVGLIAVRLQGLFLALMTLAFAFMAQELFFSKATISGVEGSVVVPRPAGVGGDATFYYLVLATLLACVLLAVSLRTGRTGRVLGAMRDSETASRALGINVVKYKVVIFGLSAFMAALGGILQSMIIESAGRLDFLPFLSLIYVALAVIGGLFHPGGAIAAGLFYALFPKVFAGTFMIDIQLILFGLGATYALAREPEGIFGELRRGGHAILRLFGRARRPRAEAAPAVESTS